jgi:hypothetical protein
MVAPWELGSATQTPCWFINSFRSSDRPPLGIPSRPQFMTALIVSSTALFVVQILEKFSIGWRSPRSITSDYSRRGQKARCHLRVVIEIDQPD